MSKDLRHSKGKKLQVDDHFFNLHEYGIDYEHNELALFGNHNYIVGTGGEETGEPGVEFTMANRFIINLLTLMKKGSDVPILIHMKTCGGDWSEGMAIYDAINMCPNPVTILNYTHARSMSSLIFLAANKRVMMPHSTYMFHRGTMGATGTVTQYLTEAEELKKAHEQMMGIYINSLKQRGSLKRKSKAKIREWMEKLMDKKEEVYIGAKEAVSLGFAHEIFDGNWDKLKEFTEDQLEIS